MAETNLTTSSSNIISNSGRSSRIWGILLLVILAAGAYFRFVGLDWDEAQHLHPDERFLTMVSSALSPVSLDNYFNTATSTLNPNNVGYTFYVYGTLPIFIARYLGELINQSGYDQVYLVGRAVSATLDLLTIFLVYLIAIRLFRSRRLALLAAAFDALSVLPIQLSHFYTVDIPANFFIFTAFYIAIRIQTAPANGNLDEQPETGAPSWLRRLASAWGGSIPYVFFGLASGMALASKISAAPLVLLLPAAALVWMISQPSWRLRVEWPLIVRNLVIGGFFCLLAFRVFQPYAFSGPGFFGLLPNQKWISSLQELAGQTSGDVDVPFALQWARRPVTFAWTNMVEWGLGYPLGLLAWAGFLWMGWRMLRGDWRRHLLLWTWTGGFFVWQSLQGNPSMRYQIPVYPSLAIIAAWVLEELWNARPTWANRVRWLAGRPWPKFLAFGLGGIVLAGTFLWAVAFSQIYLRPVTRVAATRWIYQNVPAPINVHYQTAAGLYNQPLTYPYNAVIQSGKPYSAVFTASEDSGISEITLPSIRLTALDATPILLQVSLFDTANSRDPLAAGQLTLPFTTEDKPYPIPLDEIAQLKSGHRYGLTLQLQAAKSMLNLNAPIQIQAYRQYWSQKVAVQSLQIQPGRPASLNFTAAQNGTLRKITVPVSIPSSGLVGQPLLTVAVFARQDLNTLLGSSGLLIDPSQTSVSLTFEPAIQVSAGRNYSFAIDLSGSSSSLAVDGDIQFGSLDQPYDIVLPYPVQLLEQGQPYLVNFTAAADGAVSEIYLPYVLQQDPAVTGPVQVTVKLQTALGATSEMAQGTVSFNPDAQANAKGSPLTVHWDNPVSLSKGDNYIVQVQLDSPGKLALRGSSPANESSWDDGLPLRMDGYDAYGGMYQQDLRFELYWDDNTEKVNRFSSVLDQSDYIFITSNRQWGSLTRLQERFPLTTAYYRQLLGCPPEKDVFWCYAVAEPGMFTPGLGFELVQVFQSDPNLGPLRFNSQFAEEAFTVYDAPKVLIFKKSPGYSNVSVQQFLGSVDISQEVHVTPKKAPTYPANLVLPDSILASQQAGGTWSDLFNLDALYNRYPALALLLWYLALTALGLGVYPLTRLVLGRLNDHGYPVARTIGMVILAFIVWIGGSNGIPFTPLVIWLVFAALLVVNAVLFYFQRQEISQDWSQHRRYFIVVELVTLAFFALDLAIRLGNPDLWHPSKGGEKPMDFSYLNAVLKSTSFPPYDPWFGGGFINYYYYGFVLVGVLIKWLGIVPSIAYNLFLPTLFAMVAMGAFSLGWNLVGPGWSENDPSEGGEAADPGEHSTLWGLPRRPLLAGISSSIAVLILGNLGTVKMIWEGFQRLVVSPEVMDASNIFARMGFMIRGIGVFLAGTPLPYTAGDWYWQPSRAIPGEPITEFPFFTFLYADPHAHLFALPLTLLALVWALAILKGRWNWGAGRGPWWAALRLAAAFLLGALVIGALRPTNTWDMPAYLGLGGLAIAYTSFKYGQIPGGSLLDSLGSTGRRIAVSGIWTILFIVLVFVLYQPFANWYAQAYNSIEPFTGQRTPMWAYTMHWGVFLFILTTWFAWETVDWMASTPVSALNHLRPYRLWIAAAVVFILAFLVMLRGSVEIGWLPVLLAIWAAVLLFRPGQPDSKRAVLVMTGLALVLTLAVEVVVLKGDLGRMNTVFKFYVQAWTLFSVSSAAALWWMMPAVNQRWRPGWRLAWQVGITTLVFGAALFPLFAGMDKVKDRMSAAAPSTLDGMEYMKTSTYSVNNMDMKLIQDYDAIRWMQQNIKGSPVIVEANNTEYSWGTRFTIYTGLPGVIGWSWHQRQQRAVNPDAWVTDRIEAVKNFYTTTDPQAALQFLKLYNVKYIIFGQLEKADYPGPGLDKFSSQKDRLWREVYHKDDTSIYEVIQ